MAGFRSPFFWLGLSAPEAQAGFRTPLPFWHTGAVPGLPPSDVIGGAGGGIFHDEEEILAVIMAYTMRMRK